MIRGFYIMMILLLICKHNKNVFVDTKKKLDSWISDVDFLKINDLEYEQNKDFFDSSKDILEKTIVTRGRKGCEFQGKIYPTEDMKVKDISGFKGDTFLGWFSCGVC